MINLTVKRLYKLPEYTIGKLYIDGKYFCDTLEDTDRKLYQGQGKEWLSKVKVFGKTAIPYGTYKVTLKQKSNKFSKYKQYEFCKGYLPRLINVPCFEGVLIHIGNTAKDTEGCLLVGENKKKGMVINSTKTFKKLYEILKEADNNGKGIWINITD